MREGSTIKSQTDIDFFSDYKNRNTIPSECIHDMFENQLKRTPHKTSLVFRNRDYSYSQISERSNKIANYLDKKGVKEGSVAAIFLDRSPGILVSILALFKCGASYLPIDPGLPEERIKFMLEDAGIQIIITKEKYAALFEDKKIILLDSDFNQIDLMPPELIRKKEINPSTTAYIMYTSGSTGKPKGVQITHKNVVNFLYSMKEKPGISDSDILLAVTTFTFDISVLELLLPLVTGACVVLAEKEDTLDGRILSEMLIRYAVTIMQATPATWRLLIDAGWERDPALKILCGGEELSKNLKNFLLRNGGTIWNMYGPTETTIWSSIKEITEYTPISIGKPINNTLFFVVDDKMNLLPPGVSGELLIGGAGVSVGYLNQPDLNIKKFIDNNFDNSCEKLYKTGDLVKVNEEGDYVFIGRIDNQVKIRGFRVELGEVETRIREIDGVKDSMVTAEESDGIKVLSAFIIRENNDTRGSDIRNHLKKILPEFMIPSSFEFVDSFPLTPNGKIDRKKMVSRNPGYSPAVIDKIELQLIQIWEKVLDRNGINTDDNFFEIGGHSLAVARMFTMIENEFSLRLPVATESEISTVSQMSEYIKKLLYAGVQG